MFFCVHSIFFSHLDGEERVGCFDILSSCCLVNAVWLYRTVSKVWLQLVIVGFSDNTHILLGRTRGDIVKILSSMCYTKMTSLAKKSRTFIEV